MKSIRSFIVLTATFVLAVSCIKEEYDSSSILIVPSVNETGFLSKAGIDSLVFYDRQGEEALTLYNSPYIPEPASVATKGTLINNISTLISVHGKSIKASAYNGSQPVFLNQIITKQDDGKWTLADKYYWKNNQTLEFFGCAPSDMSVTFTPNANPGAASFSYSVPTSVSSQKDILLGYYKGTGNLGTCPLKLTHSLTSIKFSFEGSEAFPDVISINSISIQGVAASGNCTVSFPNKDGSSPTYSWTVTASGNFSQSINKAPSEAAADTFILIPQAFASDSEAKIVVNLTTSSGTKDVSASLASTEWVSGKTYNYALEYSEYLYIIEEIPEIDVPHTASTDVPASIKSYRTNLITGDSEAAPWTIQYWNGTEWVDSKPATGDWALLSSMSKTSGPGSLPEGDPEVSLMNLSAQTGKPFDDASVEEYYQEVLKGMPSKEDYDLSYDNPATGTRSERPNSANCYIVSAPGTYKFPMVYGNALKDGEENKYAINDGGITHYYGRVDETFVDHRDHPLRHKDIVDQLGSKEGYDAVVVWQDAENLVTETTVDIANNCIRFSVKKENIRQGNSVIALRQNGTIVWSWHIWVTDIDLSKTFALTDRVSSYVDHLFMPCNLGWVTSGAGNGTKYDEREIKMRVSNGKAKKEFIVHQNGFIESSSEYPSSYGFCPFYQWGRKDPMIPGTVGSSNNHTIYTPSGYSVDPGNYGRATIGEAIQHPHLSYGKGTNDKYNQDDWCMGHYEKGVGFSNLWSATDVWPSGFAGSYKTTGAAEETSGNWDSDTYDYPYDNATKTTDPVAYKHYTATTIKTIYDPSPVGFCVPDVYAFDDLVGKTVVRKEMNGAIFVTHKSQYFFTPMNGYRACYVYGEESTVGKILGYSADGCYYASNAISRKRAPYAYINPNATDSEHFTVSVFFKNVAACVRPTVEAEFIQFGKDTSIESWKDGGSNNRRFY